MNTCLNFLSLGQKFLVCSSFGTSALMEKEQETRLLEDFAF